MGNCLWNWRKWSALLHRATRGRSELREIQFSPSLAVLISSGLSPRSGGERHPARTPPVLRLGGLQKERDAGLAGKKATGGPCRSRAASFHGNRRPEQASKHLLRHFFDACLLLAPSLRQSFDLIWFFFLLLEESWVACLLRTMERAPIIIIIINLWNDCIDHKIKEWKQ